MSSLARGQSSGCPNPALDLYTSVASQLVDVAVVEFQIWDVSTQAKRVVPVQVHPTTGRAAVDVSKDCPVGGRLGLGHTVAAWTVPDDEPLGTHEVRWFFRLEVEGAEHSFVEEFEVTPVPIGGVSHGYCSVADLRAEGVTVSQASDTRLAALIDEASRTVGRLTGWFFEPRVRTYIVDGRGTPSLELPAPCLRLNRLSVNGSDLDVEADTVVIAGGPAAGIADDPRISLRWGRFPVGRGNVQVEGLFGCTEDDGTPHGRTPLEIRRACMLLVLRAVAPAMSTESSDARSAWRLLEERTRDQSFRLDRDPRSASLTGDPDVDAILVRYRRPAGMGAV